MSEPLKILPQFEITPPPPGELFPETFQKQQARLIAAGFPKGSTIEITCRPGPANKNYNPKEKVASLLEVASAVSALGFKVYPHLAARMLDSDSTKQAVEGFGKLGIDRLFVVAGDEKSPYSPELPDSIALAEQVLKINPEIRELGFAAYPGLRHPQVPREQLEHFMSEKKKLKEAHPRVDFSFQTQFTFSAEEINDLAIELNPFPLRVGLVGPVSIPALWRVIRLTGYSIPYLLLHKTRLAGSIALNAAQEWLPALKQVPLPEGFKYQSGALVQDLNEMSERSPNITEAFITTLENYKGSARFYNQLTS